MRSDPTWASIASAAIPPRARRLTFARRAYGRLLSDPFHGQSLSGYRQGAGRSSSLKSRFHAV